MPRGLGVASLDPPARRSVAIVSVAGFDVSVTRKVTEDCTVRFEGRTYSVPFRWMGRQVEVRGCVEVVQIRGLEPIASHPGGTDRRNVLAGRPYEGCPRTWTAQLVGGSRPGTARRRPVQGSIRHGRPHSPAT